MKKYILFISKIGILLLTLILIQSTTFSQFDPDSIRIIENEIQRLRDLGRPLIFHRIFGIERINVINMIPNAQSNETGQDSEPNLAVNPSNTQLIVGSAFTRNPSGSTNFAPIFVSNDGGNTWALNNIVPSGNGMTGDISLDFAWEDDSLYTGILRGGSVLRQVLLRSNNPFGNNMMTVLTDHNTEQLDQPYVTAMTTDDPGSNVDRVYVGFNEFDNRTGSGGTGRTASVELSLDARTAPPAGFTSPRIEARNTAQQDMPAIRCAVHESGVVYSIFYRWASGNVPSASCDVIVVRDDNFASGTSPFTDLTDPSDGVAGRIVTAGVTVPAFPASLGANRLVASNLSIAVHPNDAAIVYIAWADRVGTTDYTLHVRRSTDSGANWSNDLLTITNATNPALAINTSGIIGFLYQQLTGTSPNQRWETHLRRTSNGSSWSDRILADTPDNNPTPTFQPYIGDYCDLIAVGRNFYGIFSASNIPDNNNFPQGVAYQRNANFTTNQLRNTTNTGNVTVSIDPFFFKVTRRTIFDLCDIFPSLCGLVAFEPGKIIIEPPFIIKDPIPKNCLVKWDCPGCNGANVLCPPYYHIYVEDINPEDWNVQIYTIDGEIVRQQINRVKNGIVLSFRPSKELYREKEIGDYYIGFEATTKLPQKRYTFNTRLEVSDFPFKEHLKRQKQGLIK